MPIVKLKKYAQVVSETTKAVIIVTVIKKTVVAPVKYNKTMIPKKWCEL